MKNGIICDLNNVATIFGNECVFRHEVPSANYAVR
jgi:hypothetical protein